MTKLHISFCLYGKGPKYNVGMIRNAELHKKIYPGSIMRVYFDNSVPQNTIDELQKLGVQLRNMTGHRASGMFWRFLIHDDPRVGHWLSRDADSRLSEREAAAVAEWLESGKELHVMRDHPWHNAPILGGMFGMAPCSFNMAAAIAKWKRFGKWQHDQQFLRERVLPAFRGKILAHEEKKFKFKYQPSRPFPTKRRGAAYVGEIISATEGTLKEHRDVLRKALNRK